jgi:glucokinase
VLTWPAHLGLTDVRFAELVTTATALPTVVVNDARAAGSAEAMLGEAHGHGVTLYVSVGTGIGGAIVVDRRLLTGGGHAGETGHVGVDRDGPPCACGRRGCWEQLAGRRALDRVAATVLAGQLPGGSRAPSARHVIAPASLGDDAARDAIRCAARAFAAGLDSVCAVLSPDRAVLGGESSPEVERSPSTTCVPRPSCAGRTDRSRLRHSVTTPAPSELPCSCCAWRAKPGPANRTALALLPGLVLPTG